LVATPLVPLLVKVPPKPCPKSVSVPFVSTLQALAYTVPLSSFSMKQFLAVVGCAAAAIPVNVQAVVLLVAVTAGMNIVTTLFIISYFDAEVGDVVHPVSVSVALLLAVVPVIPAGGSPVQLVSVPEAGVPNAPPE